MARRVFLSDIRAADVRKGHGLVAVEDTDLVDAKPDVETNFLAREVLDMVQALPDGQRLAALLVYVKGYSYREAAKFLERPVAP